MARPPKIGLQYFPLDTDCFEDIKIRKLIRCMGGGAVTVYLSLLCHIYRNGYYLFWDEDLPFIIAEQTGLDEDFVGRTIQCALALGLFSKDCYEHFGVLTSEGIQRRYAQVSAKRKSSVYDFSLLSASKKQVSDAETSVSIAETAVYGTKNTQSKVEKRKVKKRKIKEIEEEDIQKSDKPLSTSLEKRDSSQEEVFSQALAQDTVFLENTAKRFGVSREVILSAISEWVLENCAKDKRHTNYDDFRRHAFDWLRYYLSDNIYPSNEQNHENHRQSTRARRREHQAPVAKPEDYKTAF